MSICFCAFLIPGFSLPQYDIKILYAFSRYSLSSNFVSNFENSKAFEKVIVNEFFEMPNILFPGQSYDRIQFCRTRCRTEAEEDSYEHRKHKGNYTGVCAYYEIQLTDIFHSKA